VQPLVLRAEDITAVPADEPFDGVFSNFGALNCIADLRRLSQDLATLLKPGATALLCWMGPFCAWEMLWYSGQGKWDKAFRRLNTGGVTARIAEEAFVRVEYPSVRSLARAFAQEFRLKSLKGIGVAVPPSYLEGWAQRHPHLFQLCERADSQIGHCPGIRGLADHILLRFERKQATSANS
jgi:hypothetical protein